MNRYLEQAINGDKTAEEELLRFLAVRFRLFVRRWVEERAAAEDIIQDTIVTILEKYKKENFEVGFEAWAYGILRMKVRQYFQTAMAEKRKFATGLTESHMPKAAASMDPSLVEKLLACLGRLIRVNRRYARILNLIYQGYSASEISDKLKMSQGSFYVTLHRARSMLKACLGKREI